MTSEVYLVKIVECGSSHVLKAFLEQSSANEYAKYLNNGFDILYRLEEERHERVDEIMEFIYDRNGYEDSPPFDVVDAWYRKQKEKLSVPEECTHWDSFAMVEAVELEED